MKLKKMMLVTLLLLAVLTIGAVSASQDIDDNLTASDIADEPIEEASVDDVISEDSQPMEAHPQDFNVNFNTEPVRLYENENVVLNFTAPVNASGVVGFRLNNETGDCYRAFLVPNMYGKTVNITANNLGIHNPGTYDVFLTYYNQRGMSMAVANGTVTAVDMEGFTTFTNHTVTSDDHVVFALSQVPSDGILRIYVDDELRFYDLVRKSQTIELFAKDLNISENDCCNVRAEFARISDNVAVTLANYSANFRTNSSTKSLFDLRNFIWDNLFRGEHFISLESDYAYNPDTDNAFEMDITGIFFDNENVEIIGNHHIIDGGNHSPIFSTLQGFNTKIHDIIFQNCRCYEFGYSGGVITSEDYSNGYCYLIGCTFIDNYSPNSGGVIAKNGKVEECTFINNTAEANGGAVCNVEVEQCDFIGNHANGDGGAIYNCNIDRCIDIRDNTAGGNGGAMYGGQAYQSRFYHNQAQNGGAIYQGNSTQCVFFYNIAYGFGGATYEGIAKIDSFAANCGFGDHDVFNTELKSCTFYDTVIDVPEYLKTLKHSDENVSVSVSYGEYKYIDGVNVTFSLYREDEFLGDFYILSGDVWKVSLDPGRYYAVFSVYNANITPVNLTMDILETSYLLMNRTVQYNTTELMAYLKSSNGTEITNVTVTVDFNGDVKNYTTDSWGRVRLPTKDLAIGEYNITLVFEGNDVYNGTSISSNLTVTKISTEIKAEDLYTVYGYDDYLIATLIDGDGKPISGVNVTIDLNGSKTYITDGKGQVNVSTKNLAIASYAVTITYNGTDIYANATANVKVDVENPTYVIAEDMNTTYGEEKYIVVIVKDVYGNLMLNVTVSNDLDGNQYKSDENGEIRIPTKDASAGTHDVTIKYDGNETYSQSNVTVVLTVEKVNSSFNISDIVFDWGGIGRGNYTVEGGFVFTTKIVNQTSFDVYIDGNYVVISKLPAGNFTMINFIYPDENHTAVTKESRVTVNPVNSSLSIDDAVVDYGISNVTCIIEGATGVTAEANGIKLNTTGNVIEIVNLDVGTYNLTVTTVPDENHTAVSRTVNLTVNMVNSTIKIEDVELYCGTPANITVETVGAVNITAEIGGVSIPVEGFVIMIDEMEVGPYVLNVTTVPDSNHYAVTKMYPIYVNPAKATIEIEDITTDYGSPMNVTVETEGATEITAEINGKEIKVNGSVISIPVLTAGEYNLTVTAIPDENHTGANRTVTLTIRKVKSEVSIAHDVAFDYNSSGITDVSFEGATGIIAKVVNQTGAIVDVNGTLINVSGLNAGAYILEVTTVPDENHTEATATANVTVNKLKTFVSLGDDIAFDYGSSGSTKYSADCEIVVKVVGASGAVINITDSEITVSGLDAGNYTLFVMAYVDPVNYDVATATVNITVNQLATKIAATRIVTTYGTSQVMTIILKSNGTALAGKTVIIVINDVPYKRVTDENGTIKIQNPKSMAANNKVAYPVSISFAGDTNYVKSNTTTSILVKKATPKATVKGKTFKLSDRTKRYIVIVRTDKNALYDGAKVAIRVNGKTYITYAVKGKATFKLTGLNKRGNFLAAVKVGASENYNSVMVKNVKILVR